MGRDLMSCGGYLMGPGSLVSHGCLMGRGDLMGCGDFMGRNDLMSCGDFVGCGAHAAARSATAACCADATSWVAATS